eukprot:gene3789-4139_t
MSELDHALIAARDSIIRPTDSNEFSAKYDYVMVFKMDGTAGNYSIPNTAKFCLQRMHNAGLETFSYESVQRDELLVLIRCPVNVMKKFADDTDYKLELEPNKVKELLLKGHIKNDVYRVKPVEINDATMYTPFSPYNYIFAKYETGIDQDLYADFETPQNKSAHYDATNPPFNKYVRLKLINYILRAPVRLGGAGLKLNKLLFKKKMLAFYPLHDSFVTAQLRERIMKWNVWPWNFPVEDFRNYFGEKITLFQVFLGHYSHWLIWPSVIGFIFQFVVWGTGDFSSPVLPFYSLIITVWSVFMLEYWKRKEKLTAMRWGMIGYEDDEPDRPEFKGELIKSYINGGDMLYFPQEEFLKRSISSQSVIGTFITLVLGVVASIYVLRFSIQSDLGSSASTVASILNTVQITIFNYIYQKVAIHLTDMENQRTDTNYEDAMIVKLFLFQFVNSYASFFFLAFIAAYLSKPDDAPDNYTGQCGAENCMEPLSINLAIIFGTRLVLKNLTDLFIPWYSAVQKRKQETADIAADLTLTAPEEDYVLMNYNSMLEGISNYADLAIQYGFACLFVTALPIASFLSIVSNYVKAKAVGWKLTKLYQRPIPLSAEDIGTWQSIFFLISIASVITNAGLVCFTMDVLHRFDIYGRSWIFIGFQWTLIGMQFLVEQMIPDVPEEVEIQIKRQEFITAKLIDHIPDEEQVSVAEYEAWKSKSHGEADEEQVVVDVNVQPYPRTNEGLTGNPMTGY